MPNKIFKKLKKNFSNFELHVCPTKPGDAMKTINEAKIYNNYKPPSHSLAC